MAKLHLFNPDNDLALASGIENFTAPKAAADLRNAGACLPLWYGQSGDAVLTYGVNARWLESVNDRFGPGVDIFDHHSAADYDAAPWGWSLAARKIFKIEGFATDSLPTDRQIGLWRQLSHRRTASQLREDIARQLDFEIAPAAIEADSVESLRKMLGDGRPKIIKSPWSSSGRGLLDTRHVSADETLRRCEGTIQRQGSVMVEEAYDRTADFAMLFECSGAGCRFAGYSVFKADATGGYTGNILAPDSRLLEIIGTDYPAERIERVAEAARQAIERIIAPNYSGPLGVDMLVARKADGSALLDATVEINLRMTMGFVAHALSEKFLAEGSEGEYSVMPAKNTPASDSMTVESRRMVSGRIDLTPPGGRFRFVADVHTL